MDVSVDLLKFCAVCVFNPVSNPFRHFTSPCGPVIPYAFDGLDAPLSLKVVDVGLALRQDIRASRIDQSVFSHHETKREMVQEIAVPLDLAILEFLEEGGLCRSGLSFGNAVEIHELNSP